MIIREYQSADYPAIEALWKTTGIYTLERGDRDEIIRRCNSNGGKFLVLEHESTGRICGTSWLTWDGRRVFLHHFAIHPEFQSRGLGRRLAIKSIEFARSRDCPVKLEVHRDNHRAVSLYESLGFEAFEGYEVRMLINP